MPLLSSVVKNVQKKRFVASILVTLTSTLIAYKNRSCLIAYRKKALACSEIMFRLVKMANRNDREQYKAKQIRKRQFSAFQALNVRAPF